jgi:hypothetical protein
MEPLQHFDNLCDFVLTLRREHVVSLHVVNVVVTIGHVVRAHDENLGPPSGLRR